MFLKLHSICSVFLFLIKFVETLVANRHTDLMSIKDEYGNFSTGW